MAINQILSGKKYVSSFVAQQLASQFTAEPAEESHRTLSNLEFQIMILIARGKTVFQISDELSLSASTVSTYRGRVLKKMNMKNNAELMNYAIRQPPGSFKELSNLHPCNGKRNIKLNLPTVNAVEKGL